LAILAAAHYFSTQTGWTLEHRLLEKMSAPDGPSRGPAFEHFTAYLLALAFKTPRRLSSVFRFFAADSSHTSNQHDHLAQLVAAHRNESGRIVFDPVNVASHERVAYQLGTSPASEEETLQWLMDPARLVFCFPAKTVGPDIIFFLRLDDGHIVQVLTQCKHWTQNTISAQQTFDAFQTTDPTKFVSRRKPGSKSKTRYVVCFHSDVVLIRPM
jgi:hypothetical protein